MPLEIPLLADGKHPKTGQKGQKPPKSVSLARFYPAKIWLNPAKISPESAKIWPKPGKNPPNPAKNRLEPAKIPPNSPLRSQKGRENHEWTPIDTNQGEFEAKRC